MCLTAREIITNKGVALRNAFFILIKLNNETGKDLCRRDPSRLRLPHDEKRLLLSTKIERSSIKVKNQRRTQEFKADNACYLLTNDGILRSSLSTTLS